MSVQELHRPRPLGLLKMVQNRQWASLALALENGAPAHAVAGHNRLNLLEEFMKEASKEARESCVDQVRATAQEKLRDWALASFINAWKGNDPERPTPLTMATLMGQSRWVRMLLEAGHDPNEVGEGHSPVTALARRHLQGEITIRSLRQQPENGWDDEGASKRSACLDALLEAGLEIDRPAWRGACALVLACLAKDTPLILALLARKASPEGRHGPEAPPLYRLSPLEASILTHNETAVAALLRAGASPLRSTSMGPQLPGAEITLTELTGGMGQAGMLSALANTLGSKRHPALLKAWTFSIMEGNDETVEWFLSNGMRWDEPDDVGRLPIHVAALHAQESIIHRLEKEGASLEQKDAHGFSGWDHLRTSPKGMAVRASLVLRQPPEAQGSNVLQWKPRARR